MKAHPAPPDLPPSRSVFAASLEYGLVALCSAAIVLAGYVWFQPGHARAQAGRIISQVIEHTRTPARMLESLGPSILQSPRWYEELLETQGRSADGVEPPLFEAPTSSGAVWARDGSQVYFHPSPWAGNDAASPAYAVRLATCPGWDPRICGEDRWIVWWFEPSGRRTSHEIVDVDPRDPRQALLDRLDGARYLGMTYR